MLSSMKTYEYQKGRSKNLYEQTFKDTNYNQLYKRNNQSNKVKNQANVEIGSNSQQMRLNDQN